MKVYKTIIKSVSTEKSSNHQVEGKYTFLVDKGATKIDVKQAVKAIFGVDVDTVRTMIRPKKTKRSGRRIVTKRPVLKLAIVTLKGKQTIDPNKIKETKKK